MKTARQVYLDSSLPEALKAKCDTLQLKFDGWWCRVECLSGHCTFFSETDRELLKFSCRLLTPQDFVAVGELMTGTQWSQDPARKGKIYLFDLWQFNGEDLEALPYRHRYSLLRQLKLTLPPQFDLVQNYSIHDYKQLWDTQVATEKFEGVVFRRSQAPAGESLLREKYSFTEDLLVVGFAEGQGKHEGRLGALHCISPHGVQVDVGGGFDDATREEVWQSQEKYFQRYCQVEARKRFESGSLRHPNFVSWRPEGWKPE